MSETTSGRHPVNVGHLVMGLAFLGLVAIWALVQGDVVEGDDIRWLLPVPWVLAGVAGLAASVLAARRQQASADPGVAGRDGEVGLVGEDRVDPGVE
jgi:hypothetical protein